MSARFARRVSRSLLVPSCLVLGVAGATIGATAAPHTHVSDADAAARGGPVPVSTPAPSTEPGTHVFLTTDRPFPGRAFNSGWWSDTDENCCGNPNYITGFSDGAEHRDFFTFDLSTTVRRMTSARLELPLPDADEFDSLVGDPTETLGLFDVSTRARILNATEGIDLDIFADLGTGRRYGLYEVDTGRQPPHLSFRLNDNAVRDLNRKRGQRFSIGGRLLSYDPDTQTQQTLFGATGELAARLVVTFAPGPRPK